MNKVCVQVADFSSLQEAGDMDVSCAYHESVAALPCRLGGQKKKQNLHIQGTASTLVISIGENT